MTIETQNFKAWVNAQPGTGNAKLIVTGEVLVKSGERANLSEKSSGSTVELTLTIESDQKLFNQAVTYAQVRFEKEVANVQHVSITDSNGNNVANLNVETVH
eukprot:TRINITY_DN15631_c0_g1_i1.p1 TRINITY_DN15631_c0_g1~~TRINITY_DN15631_c0_g1_i1.p1  ORF type:complete len:102 (-),score=21.54 TRINITY_DN15631_c0_g1_i1:35-340(-)